MDDLLQFNPWGDFSLLFGIAYGNEPDHLDLFRDFENLFHLWFVKGTDPAGSKTEARGHGQHITSCQGYIIPSISSLSGIEAQDNNDRSPFHMGRFDKEESGYFADLLSRL